MELKQTVTIGTSGFPTSIIVTTGGSNYAVGDIVSLVSGDIGGGSAEALTLTIPDMLPTYTTQVVNLKKVYMDVEDALDTSGNLVFKVYNTLDHNLNYKYAFVTRIYDTL